MKPVEAAEYVSCSCYTLNGISRYLLNEHLEQYDINSTV